MDKNGLDNFYLGAYKTPDFAQKLSVWRAWNLVDNKLCSTYQSVAWKKNMVAECKINSHEAPWHNCTCGLYGYFDFQDSIFMQTNTIGICKVWGKAEVHKKGLRAQHSEIVGVAMVPTTQLKHRLNMQFNFAYHSFLQQFYASNRLKDIFTYQRMKNKIYTFETSQLFLYEKLLSEKLLLSDNKSLYLEYAQRVLWMLLQWYDHYKAITKTSKQELKQWAQENNVVFYESLLDISRANKVLNINFPKSH